MGLIARSTQPVPGRRTMTREQLIGLIRSDAKFLEERDDIADYIHSLPVGQALDEKTVRDGFERFKTEKKTKAITELAIRHKLEAQALQEFVDAVLRRHIFDGEHISDLFASQDLGWKARTKAELNLMDELAPLLHKLAQGREIAGLAAYEEERTA